MINPVWLRTFCTLVETGHFTRTAEKLYMTQSGVSQQVRKLEARVGHPLILREGKRFALTEAGQRMYEEGRKLVDALEDLGTRVAEDPPYVGPVRVCSPGSIGLKLYPGLLDWQMQYPGVSVDYRFAPNDEVERAVAANRADLGLMSRLPEHGEVRAEPVAEEPLCLVTPANVETVDWERLLQLGFVAHPDGAHHAGLLLRPNFSEFQHVSQFPLRGFSNQIGLILEPVARGLGFTVLPAYAVEAFGQPDRVRVQTLDRPVSECLYRVTHARRPVPARIREVMAYMARILSRERLEEDGNPVGVDAGA